MSSKTIAAPATLTVLALLSACSGPNEDAAQAAYDTCVSEEGNAELLQVDGDQVAVVIEGDNARAYSGMGDEVDNFSSTSSFDEGGLSGIAIGLVMLMDMECLVEATGYPGSSDQLRSGETWDGWRYEETHGAGSEIAMTFTAVDH
jgi:hypothetical protein